MNLDIYYSKVKIVLLLFIFFVESRGKPRGRRQFQECHNGSSDESNGRREEYGRAVQIPENQNQVEQGGGGYPPDNINESQPSNHLNAPGEQPPIIDSGITSSDNFMRPPKSFEEEEQEARVVHTDNIKSANNVNPQAVDLKYQENGQQETHVHNNQEFNQLVQDPIPPPHQNEQFHNNQNKLNYNNNNNNFPNQDQSQNQFHNQSPNNQNQQYNNNGNQNTNYNINHENQGHSQQNGNSYGPNLRENNNGGDNNQNQHEGNYNNNQGESERPGNNNYEGPPINSNQPQNSQQPQQQQQQNPGSEDYFDHLLSKISYRDIYYQPHTFLKIPDEFPNVFEDGQGQYEEGLPENDLDYPEGNNLENHRTTEGEIVEEQGKGFAASEPVFDFRPSPRADMSGWRGISSSPHSSEDGEYPNIIRRKRRKSKSDIN